MLANIGFAICFYAAIAYPISENQHQGFGGDNTYGNEEFDCCGFTHPRMFLTKEERILHLNKYKEWLENETKGVNEAIAKLKEA